MPNQDIQQAVPQEVPEPSSPLPQQMIGIPNNPPPVREAGQASLPAVQIGNDAVRRKIRF